MESSSSARAGESVPASPSQTQYSLDLDALDMDGSELLSPIPSPKVDKIASDDIDGPTDFTVNMSKWLNGNPNKRDQVPWSFGSLDEDNVSRVASDPPGKPADTLLNATGDQTGLSPASNEIASGDAKQTNQDNTDAQEPYRDAVDGAINEDSLFEDVTEGSVTPRRMEESSVWEPHHDSSSLRFTRPRSLLQPTVEDYNSEITPARPLSTVPQPTLKVTPDPPRRAFSASKLRPSSPGRPSSPTLTPVRSSLAVKKENHPIAAQASLHRPRIHVDDTRASQDETLAVIESLRARLREEREGRESLQSQLDLLQQRQRTLEQSAESVVMEHQREMEQLTNEVDSTRRAEQDALSAVDQRTKELEGARRAEREANQLAEERAKELDQMHESEDAELQDMRWQLQQAQTAEQNAKDGLNELRSQMDAQGRAHDEEVQRLGKDLAAARDEARKAADAERNAQDDLRLIRQQRNEHATALRDETQRLREELDEAQRQEETARSEADRYYNETAQLKAVQNAAQDVAVATSDDVAARRLEELRQTLEKQLREAHNQITAISKERRVDQEARRKAEEAMQKSEEARTKAEEAKRLAEEASNKSEEARHKADEARLFTTEARARLLAENARQDAENARQEAEDAAKIQQSMDRRLRDAQAQITALSGERKASQEAKAKAEEEVLILKEELEVLQNLSKLDDGKVPDLPTHAFDDLNTGYDKALRYIEVQRARKVDLKAQLREQRTRHKNQMHSLRAHLIGQKEADNKLLSDEREDHRRAIDLIEEGMAVMRHDRATLLAEVENLKDAMEQGLQGNDARQSMSAEITTLRNTLANAQSAQKQRDRERDALLADISTLKVTLENEQQQRRTDRTYFNAEAVTLRGALTLAQQEYEHVKQSLDAEVGALKRALEKAQQRPDSANFMTQISTLKRDLSNARLEIDVMKEANGDFSIQLTEKIKKREDKFRAKLKESQKKQRFWEDQATQLDKERALMSRALMTEWGKAECGQSLGQARAGIQEYLYKFPAPEKHDKGPASGRNGEYDGFGMQDQTAKVDKHSRLARAEMRAGGRNEATIGKV